MLEELLTKASVTQALGDAKQKIENALFRRSGWKITDDTDTGISFGEGAEAGFGYMEMDVVDLRPTPNRKYEMRGGYIEGGVGLGEISKAQGIVNKVLKYMPKRAKPSSDFVFLPGGGITQFIMGMANTQPELDINDFKYSSWVYMLIGAEYAFAAGDVGLMFMIDPSKILTLKNAVLASSPLTISGVLGSVMADCKAWAPYYGVSVGLGAGGKAAVRIIQSVQMNPV